MTYADQRAHDVTWMTAEQRANLDRAFSLDARDHVGAMRDWLADCDCPPALLKVATNTEVIREVDRQYDGGVAAFIRDQRESFTS